VNKLTLNFNKTHYIQFAAKTKISHNFIINYNNKSFNSIFCTKFLGIMVDGALPWKNHTEMLMKKLSKACYTIRNMKHYMSISALKVIYNSLFHSITSYGIIFWGNSSYSHATFLLQKKAIRSLLGYGNTVSCRNIFKELSILFLASQYLFSLLLFVSYNKALFSSNIDSHIICHQTKSRLVSTSSQLNCISEGSLLCGY
jgi:hypothetical protein